MSGTTAPVGEGFEHVRLAPGEAPAAARLNLR
jgi:hypothetical protein